MRSWGNYFGENLSPKLTWNFDFLRKSRRTFQVGAIAGAATMNPRQESVTEIEDRVRVAEKAT